MGNRLNTAAELWNFLSEVGVIVDVSAGQSTTTDTAAAAGDALLSVVSETGFLAGDLIRVGSGETLEVHEVEAVSAGQIDLKATLEYAQASGVAVVEQVKINLGHASEAGVTWNVTEDVFEIRASTTKLVLSRRTTGITETIGWSGILWNLSNIAIAFGVDESNVGGAGTSADPYFFRVNPDELNTLLNASLYARGSREDGDIIEMRGWNCIFDLNKTATHARNTVAELPVGAQVKTIEFQRWTP